MLGGAAAMSVTASTSAVRGSDVRPVIVIVFVPPAFPALSTLPTGCGRREVAALAGNGHATLKLRVRPGVGTEERNMRMIGHKVSESQRGCSDAHTWQGGR